MVASWIQAGVEPYGLSGLVGKAFKPLTDKALIHKTLLPETFVAEPPATITPAALMQAKYRIARFGFRDREMADLTAWCGAEAGQGWRLIHGDTGRGKTRLCMELCDHLRRKDGENWYAGMLDVTAFERDPLAHLDLLLSRSWNTLIVLDYAERHPKLAEALLHCAAGRPGSHGKLRLLFVTRRNAEMWDQMFRNNSTLQERGRGALASMPLNPAPANADAQAIFDQAFADYSKHFGASHAAPAVDPFALAHGGEPDIVLIHMLALLAVREPGEITRGGALVRDALLHWVYEREARHWAALASAQELPVTLRSHRILLGAAGALTLAAQQGAIADRQDARTALRGFDSLADLKNVELDLVIDMFRELYGGGAFFDGVTPDLFGDYVILQAYLDA